MGAFQGTETKSDGTVIYRPIGTNKLIHTHQAPDIDRQLHQVLN